MGKLIVSTQMTVDGVISGTDWFNPDGDHEHAGIDQLRAADALLLGRKTYEGLAGIWPKISDATGYADRLNTLPKFVASSTLHGPLPWNARLITGDLVERISTLKHEHGGNLISYGCGGFARYLAEHGLVDEVRLWVHPVVWGDGDRPFHDGVPIRLRLMGTTTFRTGVTLQRYQPVTDKR